MSVLHLHKRRDPSDILYYAPRRTRDADDGRSIRPVLERLRRGDGDDPAHDTQIVQDAPALDFDAGPVGLLQASDPFSVIGRIVVVAGVAGGLGLLAVNLYQPGASGPAPARTVAAPQPEPSALPRKVHTLTFQADSATAVQPSAEPASAVVDAGAAPAATAPEQALTNDAATDPPEEGRSTLTVPLKLWALVPPDLPAAEAPPIAQASPAAELKQPPAEPPASAAPPAPPKAAGSTHRVHHVHHAHRRPHHRRRHRTHATHRATAAAQEAAATANAQSSGSSETAIQALFGHPEAKAESNPAK